MTSRINEEDAHLYFEDHVINFMRRELLDSSSKKREAYFKARSNRKSPSLERPKNENFKVPSSKKHELEQ